MTGFSTTTWNPKPSRRPQSPLGAVASLGRPIATFVWAEKRGVALTVVLYVLGLVVWALNASRRDLGLGATTDLRYLLAGVVPALVLAVALAVIVAWFRLPAWSRDRLASWRPGAANGLAAVGSVLFTVGIFAIAILGWSGLLERVPALAVVVFAAFGTGLVLFGLTREETFVFRLIWYVYAPILIAVLVALALAFYAEGVYPWLPQSLGGGKPRCAQLDLDASSLSSETVAGLVPDAPTADRQIVRTKELDVVFTQGETLFVEHPDDDRVLELRGGSIHAVVGCG